MNQAAVDRIEERPLPDIGDTVIYYPRAGERRRGRARVPAIVIHVDAHNRRLDLAIIHEANDMLDQQNVPERVGEDRGWLRKETDPVGTVSVHHDVAELAPVRAEIDAAKADIAAVKEEQARLSNAIFGPHPQPKESVLEMLGILDSAIDEVEAKLNTPSPQPAIVQTTFRRRGRPPGPQKPKVA
jgi:hypothetical protein